MDIDLHDKKMDFSYLYWISRYIYIILVFLNSLKIFYFIGLSDSLVYFYISLKEFKKLNGVIFLLHYVRFLDIS